MIQLPKQHNFKSFEEKVSTNIDNIRLITDLDIEQILDNGSYCVSVAQKIADQIVGLILDISTQPKIKTIWDKAVSQMPSTVTPYFGMLSNTAFGPILTILYIPSSEDDWTVYRDDIVRGDVCAYSYNIDDDFGEIGYIGFKMFNGGPIRTR